jgi:hypothetical protein
MLHSTAFLFTGDVPVAQAGHARDDVILDALVSRVSRSILVSTMEHPKSVEEISRDSDIPTSTCYLKVAELLDRGLLRRERIVITRTGKRYALYRAAIRSIYVEFGAGGLDVSCASNGDDAGDPLASSGLLAPGQSGL